MKAFSIRDIAELVGITALVASLIFVALQIRQQQVVAEVEAYVDSAGQWTELTQLINDNRDVWVKGLKGEELSEVDESIFHGLAFAVFQRKVAQYQRARRLNVGNADRRAEAFAYEIYTYPGLRRWFDELGAENQAGRAVFDREAQGSGSTMFAVREALAELDLHSPPLPNKKSYNIE
jgi:hypothetical protein